MPSPFHGINLASNALRAFQRQLDVTGHNIANVNTPGYSRQVADLSQADGTTVYGINPYSLGNGVTIDNVNRIRDGFLEMRRMTENSTMGRFTSMASNLQRVQGVIVEPSPNGIADSLDKFFNSWSALASNPTQPGAREEVQAAGNTLASRIRGTYLQLNQLEGQTNAEVSGTLTEIDTIATRIADLNAQIRSRLATGEQPNDLLDMRDQALQDLSQLVDITTFKSSDGGVSVYVNQFALIDSSGSRPIPKTYDAATSSLTDGTLTYTIKAGKLGGLLGALNGMTNYKGQLDTLANSLRTGINTLHLTGTNPNATTNIRFFNDVTPPALQTGAIDFDLDPAVKADVKNISNGTSGAAGDGGLALALSRLRDDVAVTGLGGKTFSQFYTNLVGTIGRDSATAETAIDTQVAVLEQIDIQRQSISGVSIDDEMANMMRFQRSFQAAAKALTVFDQVTEDLINMLKR